MTDTSIAEIERLQARLGLRFRQPELLLQALTHRSYVNEQQGKSHKHNPDAPYSDHYPDGFGHNERLEFLGDAVLDFVAGDYLYQQFPDMREGQLTRLRSSLVCTETLAEFAMQSDLAAYLRLGIGEDENGGRARQSNLCAAFEAVVGALYLDQGIAQVETFVIPYFQTMLGDVRARVSTKDAKSRLQEWSQAQEGRITPHYVTLAAEGPDHAKEFTVEVRVGETPLGWGVGRSKRLAEQAAADMALENVRRQNERRN